MSRHRFTLITGLLLTLLSLGFLGMRAVSAKLPVPITLSAPTETTLGARDAPRELLVVTDYRCPHCRAFEHATLPHLQKQLEQGTLRLAYLPVAALGAESELAAHASLCAARTGNFSALHQPLFELPEVNTSSLLELAQQQGLEPQSFKTCLEDTRVAQEVTRLTQLARDAGVKGTPTVVVAGLAYPNPDWQTLEQALEPK